MKQRKMSKGKAKTKKEYTVNVDMKWSKNYTVKAESISEAKKLAWDKFKTNLPKSCFSVLIDKGWE
jgi:hypothetical protein